MSHTQSKITHHTKNQESHYLMRKRQSTDIKIATHQILELSKILKQPLKILYKSITNSLETDKNLKNPS